MDYPGPPFPPAPDGIRTVAATAAFVAYHADQRPASVAVIDGDSEITYAEFHRDLGRITAAVRQFGLHPGQTVAIEWTAFYHHFLLVLAFETLGVVTASFDRETIKTVQPLLKSVDLVIGSPGMAPKSAKRVHELTGKWIEAALAGKAKDNGDLVYLHPDTPVRIGHTSGTTGRTKWKASTARNQEFWINQCTQRSGYSRQTRYMLHMGFAIQSIYSNSTACLRAGGTCIIAGNVSLAQALTKYEATHVTLLPVTLMTLLDTLPEGYVKPPDLTLLMIGAPVPKAIRKRALDRLAVNLIDGYGTNETGPICTMNADGTGTVLPGVRVEVVDDQDRPVMGQPGPVRIKSDGCTDGYIGDPETTARMFRDGWFYPGDRGVMEDADTLALLGRDDDILNIRGLKIAPHRIEEILAEGLPVKDVGVTALPDPDGNNVVWVALVLDGSRKLADLEPQIIPLLPEKLGRYEIVAVKKIPRTPTGKIQRNTLNTLLRNRG